MIELGTLAPDFELPDQNGNIRSLKEFRGKKVILYFYPKDNTAGCTKQACGFSELYFSDQLDANLLKKLYFISDESNYVNSIGDFLKTCKKCRM